MLSDFVFHFLKFQEKFHLTLKKKRIIVLNGISVIVRFKKKRYCKVISILKLLELD